MNLVDIDLFTIIWKWLKISLSKINRHLKNNVNMRTSDIINQRQVIWYLFLLNSAIKRYIITLSKYMCCLGFIMVIGDGQQSM